MNLLDFSNNIMQLVRQQLVFGSGNNPQDHTRTGGWSAIINTMRERPFKHFYQKTGERQFSLKLENDFSKMKEIHTVMPEMSPLIAQYGLEGYFNTAPDSSFFKGVTKGLAESMLFRTGNCDSMSHLFLYFFSEKFPNTKAVQLYVLASDFLGHAIVKIIKDESTIYVDPWAQTLFPEADSESNMRIILDKLQTAYEFASKTDETLAFPTDEFYKNRLLKQLNNIQGYLRDQKGAITVTDPKLGFVPVFCITDSNQIPNIDLQIEPKFFIKLVNLYRDLQILLQDIFPHSPLSEAITQRDPHLVSWQKSSMLLQLYPDQEFSLADKLPKPLKPNLKEQIIAKRSKLIQN